MSSITTDFDRTTHGLCTCCSKIYPLTDFAKRRPARRPPLRELDPNTGNSTNPNAESNTTELNPCKQCVHCRDKRKNVDIAIRERKKQKVESDKWPCCSWQELCHRMEEGYRS
jgi:hypothetical protein